VPTPAPLATCLALCLCPRRCFVALLVACGGSKDAPTSSAPDADHDAGAHPKPRISAARLRAKSDSAVADMDRGHARQLHGDRGLDGHPFHRRVAVIKPTTTDTATYVLECTRRRGTVSKSVTVEAWLPIPAAGTSYDNWKPNGRGEIAFPASTVNTAYQGLPTAHGFGDFFQTGRRTSSPPASDTGPTASTQSRRRTE